MRLQSETDDKEQLKRENHRFKRQPSAEQVQKRIATFMDRLKKLKLNMKQKVRPDHVLYRARPAGGSRCAAGAFGVLCA